MKTEEVEEEQMKTEEVEAKTVEKVTAVEQLMVVVEKMPSWIRKKMEGDHFVQADSEKRKQTSEGRPLGA